MHHHSVKIIIKKVPLFFTIFITTMIILSGCSEEPPTSDTVTDKDGNIYQTVTIGTQTWMVENLKTTTFNDGTPIPLVSSDNDWSNLSTPGYSWYNNDEASYKNTYGALYNWDAVNTGKLAPKGWHVATDAEWRMLERYVKTHVGPSGTIAKALAATSNWSTFPDAGTIGSDLTINDSSGFSGIPGGYRHAEGTFNLIGIFGHWWTSTEATNDTEKAWLHYMTYDYSNVYTYYYDKSFGFSVRCVMD